MPSPSPSLCAAVAGAALAVGCGELPGGPSLSKRHAAEDALLLGERQPSQAEVAVVGSSIGRIQRGTPAFAGLVRCTVPEVVFKDEESTGADRMMTEHLCASLERLTALVSAEWPGVKLRVTEAWDERGEHGKSSIHYEGRAADITTSDVDPKKLGRLAHLAVNARLDWVYYEDPSHVHVSVRRSR